MNRHDRLAFSGQYPHTESVPTHQLFPQSFLEYKHRSLSRAKGLMKVEDKVGNPILHRNVT